MQLAHYKRQVALGLMKAEQAAEDAKKSRHVSSTALFNRNSDIPGAGQNDCVNHIHVKVAQLNAERCKMPQFKRKTHVKCKKCKVYLCIEVDGTTNCFEQFQLV
ncbi:hypothetical protein HPB48_000606 [Haemaphysalis longicornis]|uniref:Uncharacterized protein n=1 Tax=Haemaphysalis longicornis TaxID=44386 RepID=A0A9J6H527_HAELO|nr:hypothetical protein HPB48_000606 [Haemaphysalis longicornis]